MSTIEITSENFQEHVDKDGILFVDCWAEWCGPCRAFAPIYDAAAAKHPDITWGKLDTEAHPALAGALEIRAIPTLLVFRDRVLLFAQAGLMPPAGLQQLVDKVKALDMDEVRRKIREHETAHAHHAP